MPAQGASPFPASFDSSTTAWFDQALGAPTRVQREGWPAIARHEHTLLLAPTGSGKTLAAFLACLDGLVGRPVDAAAGVKVLYISPLKALVVDVERNLRAPLLGLQRMRASRGLQTRDVRVDVRTGDTPPAERRAQRKHPADILVTTPESLYLLLTQDAREVLAGVETVIIDEIHTLSTTKRGVHLALSLERLSELVARAGGRDPQRIGLSATQRPLSMVARYLGGTRPVSIIDAAEPPKLAITIEVPTDEMATRRGGDLDDGRPKKKPAPPRKRPVGAPPLVDRLVVPPDNLSREDGGMWGVILPRILELIRAHTSTLVFTNSRILCERIARKLNDLAGSEIVLAHHGSLSHTQRRATEERLKQGSLPALVATSSLELGIDMGAIDLVILVESPGAPSRGLQRVGRAGHHVGATSEGVVFPKFRGDLLEAAVVTRLMLDGAVEQMRAPTSCLDVLAQQIAAMVAMEPWAVSALEHRVRQSAAFADLPHDAFLAVLEMLAGRYPSEDFAGLMPRVVWDRVNDTLTARRGLRPMVLMNGGTIPDRGLFGVHLPGEGDRPGARVGELDEEMVYESRVGDTIVLGASTWRVQEIGRDRVVVAPAPGEPGRLPFWHGDRPSRPLEVGEAMGGLLRTLQPLTQRAGEDALATTHPFLDARARTNLMRYVRDQVEATGTVPHDRAITLEMFRDELGDLRICLLTPFGAKVHAPWAHAIEQKLGLQRGFEAQVLSSDDGIALRLTDADKAPDTSVFFPEPEELDDLVLAQLEQSALFASRFRENAARALLIPRRSMKGRSPLWLQRKRSQDLLAVARKYPQFPIVLETTRECLKDTFDLPALKSVLGKIRSREIAVVEVETKRASPFAQGLIFQYVAAFLYDGDAPLAEKRALALSLDRTMLRELLGEDGQHALLDPAVVAAVADELQLLDDESRTEGSWHADRVHDLLRRLGDLSRAEIGKRSPDAEAAVPELIQRRRAVELRIAGETRVVAAEDAARYRDALGAVLPLGLPDALLQTAERPVEGLVRRFARTHTPFCGREVADRVGLALDAVEAIARELLAAGTLVDAGKAPDGAQLYCDADVMRRLKRRTLAVLRDEIAPVEPEILARFLLDWHGIAAAPLEAAPAVAAAAHAAPVLTVGPQALEEAIARLEGVPLPFSVLEDEILPLRVRGYRPGDLDQLGAQGSVVWVGAGALGTHDGRVQLYRRHRFALLHAAPQRPTDLDPAAERLLRVLEERGALFGAELVQLCEGGERRIPPKEVAELLFQLVWRGLVTNDTFGPLRGLRGRGSERRPRHVQMLAGRWSAVATTLRAAVPPTDTARVLAWCEMLLDRSGVIARQHAAELPGGFSAVLPALRILEEQGRVRRGHFVAELVGAQFAHPGAVERLRNARSASAGVVTLAAVDPALPYGDTLPWPASRSGNDAGAARPRRSAGARVVLVHGRPVLFVEKGAKSVVVCAGPEGDGADLAHAVAHLRADLDYRSLRVSRVDGEPPAVAASTPALLAAGFVHDDGELVLTGKVRRTA